MEVPLTPDSSRVAWPPRAPRRVSTPERDLGGPFDDSRLAQRKTFVGEYHSSPRWSRDGRHLAFLPDRAEGGTAGADVMGSEGGHCARRPPPGGDRHRMGSGRGRGWRPGAEDPDDEDRRCERRATTRRPSADSGSRTGCGRTFPTWGPRRCRAGGTAMGTPWPWDGRPTRPPRAPRRPPIAVPAPSAMAAHDRCASTGAGPSPRSGTCARRRAPAVRASRHQDRWRSSAGGSHIWSRSRRPVGSGRGRGPDPPGCSCRRRARWALEVRLAGEEAWSRLGDQAELADPRTGPPGMGRCGPADAAGSSGPRKSSPSV